MSFKRSLWKLLSVTLEAQNFLHSCGKSFVSIRFQHSFHTLSCFPPDNIFIQPINLGENFRRITLFISSAVCKMLLQGLGHIHSNIFTENASSLTAREGF